MAKAIEDALAALQYKDVVTTPSSTPASTKTPPPNRTSVPTKTPAPNKTAAPTATPAAESTATPTPTPAPTPAPQDTIAQDSHTSSPALWIILILVIGGAVFAIAVFGKKKKNNR